MTQKIYSYPEPSGNPNCLCAGGMTSFVCHSGHLTECHSGMTCDVARCAHLPKYAGGAADYEVENAPQFNFKLVFNEKELVQMPVFAPSAELAGSLVKMWVAAHPNLSTLDIKIVPIENPEFDQEETPCR